MGSKLEKVGVWQLQMPNKSKLYTENSSGLACQVLVGVLARTALVVQNINQITGD